MSKLTPRYSADRAVIDYTEKYYIPAAETYRKRAENQGALAKQIVEWQHTLNQKWPSLCFGDVKVQTNGDKHHFEVQLFLGDLDPNAIKVELFADGTKNPQRQEMARTKQIITGTYIYQATVPASRPALDYTPRAIPFHPAIITPLEAPQILWQK